MFKQLSLLSCLKISIENTNEGWDGTCKNVASPNGTYMYQLKCRDVNGLVENKKGTVILFR